MEKKDVKSWMHYYEKRPKMIKISLVNNCNLRCSFCGCHNAVGWGTKDIMKFVTFKRIVDQLDERTKMMEFAVKSEPTLHPDLVLFVAYLRKKAPWMQIWILSNGVALLKDMSKVFELYQAGLNFIYLDSYSVKQTELWQQKLKDHDIDFKRYGIKKEWSHASKKNPWSYHGPKTKYFLLTDEIQNQRRANRVIHTQGGSTPEAEWNKHGIYKEDFPFLKPCTQTHYMMVFDWDGTIEKCCSAWDRVVTHGNINYTSIEEVWTSDKWKNVQHHLDKGRRDLVPGCFYCNVPSFRAHFYPYVGPEFKEELISD